MKFNTETHFKWRATWPIMRFITLIGLCAILFGCFFRAPYIIDPWYAFVSEEETIWLDQDSLHRGYFTKYVLDHDVRVFVHAGALKKDQSENKCAIIVSLEISGVNLKQKLRFFPDSTRFSLNGKPLHIKESSFHILKRARPRAVATFQAVSEFGSCRCEHDNSIKQGECIIFDFRKTIKLDNVFLPIELLTGTFEKP